jgi:hypothetical protein
MTEKSKHNSKTARKKSLQGHKGSHVASEGQKGPEKARKGQKGPIGSKKPFKHHIPDQKQLFTISYSKSTNE